MQIEFYTNEELLKELFARTRNAIFTASIEGRKAPESFCLLKGSPTEILGLTQMLNYKLIPDES